MSDRGILPSRITDRHDRRPSASTLATPALLPLTVLLTAACAAGEPVVHFAPDADPGRLMEIEDEVGRALVINHLDQYLRVQRVAAELRRGRPELCDLSGGDLGLTVVSAETVPTWLAALAVPLMQLQEGPRIVDVRPASPAAASGLRVGDYLVSVGGRTARSAEAVARAEQRLPETTRVEVLREGVRYEVALTPALACPAPRVRFVVDPHPAAFAERGAIILTTAMVNFVADDHELAFVIAHEMAHDLLGHTGGAVNGIVESDADVLGAKLMEGAGYSPGAGLVLLLRLAGEPHVPADRKEIAGRIAVLEAWMEENDIPGVAIGTPR